MSTLTGYNEPVPSRDAWVEVTVGGKSLKGYLTDDALRWLEQSLLQRVNNTPFRLQEADQLTAIAASDSGTLGGDQVAGLYRVNVYREVTVADPVSSGLAITLTWTHNGNVLTRTLSAFASAPQLVGDNASDVELVEVQEGTPILYTMTYASAGGVARFAATLTAELIQPIG